MTAVIIASVLALALLAAIYYITHQKKVHAAQLAVVQGAHAETKKSADEAIYAREYWRKLNSNVVNDFVAFKNKVETDTAKNAEALATEKKWVVFWQNAHHDVDKELTALKQDHHRLATELTTLKAKAFLDAKKLAAEPAKIVAAVKSRVSRKKA